MILIQLDNTPGKPIYRQIVEKFTELMNNKVLQPGDHLPSSRELSIKLGVNRSTVYRAYQELWAKGLVDCRSGSYTTVRYRRPVNSSFPSIEGGLIDWETYSVDLPFELIKPEYSGASSFTEDDVISFIALSPDPRIYPVESYRKSQMDVMRQKGSSLLQYGDPMGYQPLRDFISQRSRLHGMRIEANQVLITNGVQQSLNLILQYLTRQGTTVVVEEPTYSSALPVFALHGVKVVGVPMLENGVDLEKLETVINQEKPTLFYTMPNFQNPTGRTSSHQHRENLMTLCQKAKLPIVEDGFEEELKYFGKAVIPLKAMDQKGIVLYLGTFSKILFPGLRIGWIAADPFCISGLKILKQINDTAGNIMEQAALHNFCRSGHLETHIKRVHREYRKRMKTALQSVRQHVPDNLFHYTVPDGGYTIWFKSLKADIVEEELITAITNAKVRVSPGSLFLTGQRQNACFRISIAHRNEEEIREGIERLGTALRSFS